MKKKGRKESRSQRKHPDSRGIHVFILFVAVWMFLLALNGPLSMTGNAGLTQTGAETTSNIPLTFQMNLRAPYWQPLGLTPPTGTSETQKFECPPKQPCIKTLDGFKIGPNNDCQISITLNIPDPSNPSNAHIVKCTPSGPCSFTMNACSDIKFGGMK